MANAFSIPANFGRWIDPVNEGLINQVLQSKDQKYDYNVAKIDNVLQQYTNLPLAREQDKQYLKSRIDNILKTVNGAGKLNMSDDGVTRQIEQSIAGAIDENVLNQVANTKAIQNFEQTVAEKRKKNPELYDDRNYTYAKKAAGLDAYMSGQSNEIGNLNYKDYYDIDTNLTVELEKWAKDFGFTKSIKEDGTLYFIRKETSEELKPEQIEDFYRTKMQADPKLAGQMEINSAFDFAQYDDNEFREGYLANVKSRKEELTTTRVEIEEQKKNLPPGDERIAQLDDAISNYNEAISQYDKEINNPNFNRRQKEMEVYSNNLLNSYKKTYAKKNVTSIDYDDTPMKIAEFEWKKEKYEKEKAAEQALATEVGTPFTKIVTDEEGAKADPFTQQEQAFTSSYHQFHNQLMASDENYAKGDEATRKAIRAKVVEAVRSENIGAQPYSKETIQIADNYINNSEVYTKAKTEINKRISTEVESYFNGMKGSAQNINLQNLAGSMPVTARLLADAKTNSFKALTAEQKAQVSLEIANSLKNDIAEDGLDKKFIDGYITEVTKNSGISYTPPPSADRNSFKSLWKGFSSGVSMLWNSTVAPTLTEAVNVFRNSENAELARDENMADLRTARQDFVEGSREFNRSINRKVGNDTDLGSLSSDEVSLGQGETIRSRWGNVYKSIENEVLSSLGQVSVNNSTTTGKSFNPNVKEEKPYTTALESVVISRGINPAKGSAYQIEFTPDRQNAIITVDTATYETSDKGVQRTIVTPDQPITVPVSALPKAILNSFDLSNKNWNYDPNNPTNFKKTHAHTAFKDSTSRDEFLEKFERNHPGALTPALLYSIKSNPKASPFKTQEEYQDTLIDYGRKFDLSPEQLQEMNQTIVLPEYKVDYERVRGQGFVASIKKGNKVVQSVGLGAIPYDPTEFTTLSFTLINKMIDKQLQEYAKQHSR